MSLRLRDGVDDGDDGGDGGAGAPRGPGFFQRGRELESINTNHHYTADEIEVLKQFESIDYLPCNSEAYRAWLRKQPASTQQPGTHARWIMMFLIGLAVGLTGFLLKSTIQRISEFKYVVADGLVASGNMAGLWAWVVCISVVIVFVSSALVVFVQPAAAASGIPETIAYLNGAHIPAIFNIRTVVVKFLSCACAVGSGLPVGPEGPMIHLGAMLGKGLSQGQSRTMGFATRLFRQFRNMRDRRDFISAGAAAGVASAFGAPVGGLLFSMEEVSSFWSLTLSWQTFFCCMVSTCVTDWLLSAFGGFRDKMKSPIEFGLFKDETSLLFQVEAPFKTHMLLFLPTIVIGLCGGCLGTVFTFFNLKWARVRKRFITPRRALRILEPCLLMMLWALVTLLVPELLRECKPTECEEQGHEGAIEGAPEHPGNRTDWCALYSKSSGRGIEELHNYTTGEEGLRRYPQTQARQPLAPGLQTRALTRPGCRRCRPH